MQYLLIWDSSSVHIFRDIIISQAVHFIISKAVICFSFFFTIISRSAISGPLKEEMETFHGMKKNIPPLLPVPSQSSSSSDGEQIN